MSSTHSRRIKFVSISVPILYGNHAIKLTPEKRKPTTPPEHTHEWTVFFKPVLGDIDLTPLIKKVTFKLHELGINEKNFQIFHALKLHPYNPQAPQVQQPQAQQSQAQPPQQQFGGEGGSVGTIIRERENGEVHLVLYDELVFNEPTEKTFEILTSKPVNLIPYKLLNLDKRDQEYIRPDEIDELNRMDIYIDKVKQEIENQRNQYKLLEQEKLALLQ